MAKDDAALERVLQEYNDVLAGDTVNIVSVSLDYVYLRSKMCVASSETSDRTSSKSIKDR